MKFPDKFPFYGFIGIGIILFSEISLLLNLWVAEIFMTPLCWSGLILFLDALNYRLSGHSLIMTRRKEFYWMLPWSIVLWYLFEFYNLFLKNWYYIGLPESKWIRYPGYFWSFATIFPGVLEIYDLIRNLKIMNNIKAKPVTLSGFLLTLTFTFGLFCLSLPFWVTENTARYMAAPVWIGFIFFLDPLNYSWRQASLWRDWSRGDLSRLIQLFLAGFIAGILWEFWNYWATAKWIYTVPIFEDVKIFEMPVVGYLGFLPFAVEIYVMWETVRFLLKLK